MKFEVCVDSVEGALAAQQGGAQRVELCADLVEGGVTPSLGLIRQVRQAVSIDIHILIRPRGGDFLYSPWEYAAMRDDIQAARDAGAQGVVLGIMLPDGQVDAQRTTELVELARPMSVTFHRAIDMSRSSPEALEILIHLGVDRVLTSGRQPSALQGADCIASLVQQSAGRTILIAAGGITAGNLPQIISATHVGEVHFSARSIRQSAMIYRNLTCFMGKTYQPDEYTHKVTDADLVRQVIEAGL